MRHPLTRAPIWHRQVPACSSLTPAASCCCCCCCCSLQTCPLSLSRSPYYPSWKLHVGTGYSASVNVQPVSGGIDMNGYPGGLGSSESRGGCAGAWWWAERRRSLGP